MAAYKFLLFERENGIATVTLNRPEVYNALNDEITYELQDAFREASRDESIRVVILTGQGKAFCAGQDLKASSSAEKRSFMDSLHKRYNPLIRSMRGLPKPVICRLNGVAAGAGCSIALACDMIIASENATLIEVFINIGLVPDSGSSFFLPRLTGMAKAFELCTLGSKIKAEEAQRIGLVNYVVPPDKLDDVVNEYADRYAAAPTKAIGLIKK